VGVATIGGDRAGTRFAEGKRMAHQRRFTKKPPPAAKTRRDVGRGYERKRTAEQPEERPGLVRRVLGGMPWRSLGLVGTALAVGWRVLHHMRHARQPA
jgi:hypothetical protein